MSRWRHWLRHLISTPHRLKSKSSLKQRIIIVVSLILAACMPSVRPVPCDANPVCMASKKRKAWAQSESVLGDGVCLVEFLVTSVQPGACGRVLSYLRNCCRLRGDALHTAD